MKKEFLLVLAYSFMNIIAYSQSTITIREICVEDCSNGIDDDNDGLADCEDRDCIDYLKSQYLLKSNNDSTLCLLNVLQDSIVTWGDCIDIIEAGIIDTSAISLDSIVCIRYDPMESSCGLPTESCNSTLLCPDNDCGDYFVSLIGPNDRVLTSEVVHVTKKEVTFDMLQCAFPDTDSMRLVEVVEAFNAYQDQFEINTPLRIAHFMGQIAHETNGVEDEFEGIGKEPLEALRESSSYSAKNIVCNIGWSAHAVVYEGYTDQFPDSCNRGELIPVSPPFNFSKLERIKSWAEGSPSISASELEQLMFPCQICGNCSPKDSQIIDSLGLLFYAIDKDYNSGELRIKEQFLDSSDIFNVRYGCREDLENGSFASGDGADFAGVGFIHITGRYNNGIIADSIANDSDLPIEIRSKDLRGMDKDLFYRDVDIAMISAFWFWRINNLNSLIEGNTINEDVLKLTLRINGADLGLASRRSFSNLVYEILINGCPNANN